MEDFDRLKAQKDEIIARERNAHGPAPCIAKAYGGDWCKTFCMMPKDCSALPDNEA